jgi:hypothetical protein
MHRQTVFLPPAYKIDIAKHKPEHALAPHFLLTIYNDIALFEKQEKIIDGYELKRFTSAETGGRRIEISITLSAANREEIDARVRKDLAEAHHHRVISLHDLDAIIKRFNNFLDANNIDSKFKKTKHVTVVGNFHRIGHAKE